MTARDDRPSIAQLLDDAAALKRIAEEMRNDAKRARAQEVSGSLGEYTGRRGANRRPSAANALLIMLSSARKAAHRYAAMAEYYGEAVDEKTEAALLKALDAYIAALAPRTRPAPKSSKTRGRPPIPPETKELQAKIADELVRQHGLTRRTAMHHARRRLRLKRLVK